MLPKTTLQVPLGKRHRPVARGLVWWLRVPLKNASSHVRTWVHAWLAWAREQRGLQLRSEVAWGHGRLTLLLVLLLLPWLRPRQRQRPKPVLLR
jgi:hypothetical protein